jgi:penicillin-binding protein 1B
MAKKNKTPGRKSRRAFWILTALLIASLTMMGGVVLYSEWKLSQLVPGGLGESFPTKVYSAPLVISNDTRVSVQMLITRLVRLNYFSTPRAEPAVGQYHAGPSEIAVNLRGFQAPFYTQPPGLVKFTWGADQLLRLENDPAGPAAQAALEPELAAELSGPKKIRRDPAAWEDFPASLIDAVIAVEDRRFYKHHGIDARAMLRAAVFNVRNPRKLQGGSTITQQLAKNFFLTSERTLQRKLLEVAFALYLDFRTPKNRILTLYLNEIYMGQDGPVSIAGMRAAAQFYFGKDVRQLTLPESAMLAGLIRSPYRYNPFVNPTVARGRRNTVLRQMLDENYISEHDFEKARHTPLALTKIRRYSADKTNPNDYFVSEVLRELLPRFTEDTLFRYGLRIYTTLDPVLQKDAQETIRLGKHQGALIAIEPMTGRVLALVGGRDYKESQFNRATQARRQPGSIFKPFVYGAALAHGFTPATILTDEPRAFRDGKKIWAPQNYDGQYRGKVTLRDAIAFSLNAATLDLAQKIGVTAIATFAKEMGIESPLDNSLVIALGASEVTPFEVTAAYAPFANGGFHVRPFLVTAVTDSDNNILETNSIERRSVLDPVYAYLMTSLLQSVILDGTAKNAAKLGWTDPSAGKTGTTNQGRDAWFVGYTPELLTGVWTGDDNGASSNLYGAKDALPMWVRFMSLARQGRPPLAFQQPRGLIEKRIDPTTGALARSGCPIQKNELFVIGTEPKNECPLHVGGFRGWLKKLFGS